MYRQLIRNYLCRSGKKKQKGGESLITRNVIICTAHKVKEVEMDGARGLHGIGLKCMQNVGKLEGRRPFGRLMRRWEPVDLGEVGW